MPNFDELHFLFLKKFMWRFFFLTLCLSSMMVAFFSFFNALVERKINTTTTTTTTDRRWNPRHPHPSNPPCRKLLNPPANTLLPYRPPFEENTGKEMFQTSKQKKRTGKLLLCFSMTFVFFKAFILFS